MLADNGIRRLPKVMQWCREFGVKEVTVYALSLENFKRSRTEVDDLMTLFEHKLLQLLDERDKLTENGIRIQFFGNLKHLPRKLQQYMAKIELLTREHNSGTVNVCIAYTSQDELRRAFVTIAHGIQKGLLTTTDINECLISRCLDSRFSRDPDLLIRTSGETRLSDFLLWQCSKCQIYFDGVLWPNFDYWNLSAK
ncbi:Uncharacterized protein BM_BM5483 [Brugia malayi]|uniref:Alkyl transferase n=1 Tax=Brugia malayi TaxID=6279 RepID=A0A4E9FR92_BRUMA|nr:Uncharacterized protein BM_BM5483 [Brugia malayi]VIO99693.1 Uncharacterized protein BM_BM5483 [Brugia malayi]